MSPEQCAPGKPIDCRADIYSLGMTAYHMVTEEVPFGGRNAMEVIRRQMFDSVPNPRELNPEISHEFAALIEKMTSKSTSKRPENWDELLALLAPIIAKHPR
jgi:serine/threonine protein kinase